MKKLIFLSLCVAILSCKKDETKESATTNTPNLIDVQPAKNYYNSLGAQFQSRIAYAINASNTATTTNYTSLNVYAIIEGGGKVAVLYNALIPGIIEKGGALLDCKGDYLSSEAGPSFNQGYQQKAEADILPNNDLIMYVYDDLARGGFGGYGNIGNQGGSYHNVTKNVLQNALTPNGSFGYMYVINNQPYYFSLHGAANPADLFTYNTISKTWSSQTVTAMAGTYKNFIVSHDVAKVGNTDLVYWAYLSFKTDFNVDGQINILSFDGTTFTTPKSLTIGDIGEGSAGNRIYKHSVMLCKNGSDVQQPYIVVRRYNTDILDIYKFNGTTIEKITQDVSLPNEIKITYGSLRRFNNIVGINGNIYLFATDGGNYIFKLNGNKFEKVYDNFLKSDERFTAIEATSKGLLVSISKVIPTTPKQTEVSDLVLIPN